MSDPSIAAFKRYLESNPNVRSQVEHLERSLAAAFKQEAESVAAIAAGAGFDVTGWAARPAVAEPTPNEFLSGCCGFMTIGTDVVVKALGS